MLSLFGSSCFYVLDTAKCTFASLGCLYHRYDFGGQQLCSSCAMVPDASACTPANLCLIQGGSCIENSGCLSPNVVS